MVRDLESTRMQLHTILTGLLDEESVIYSPSSNTSLVYPCIIYDFNKENSLYANNLKYGSMLEFSITLMTLDVTDPLFSTLNNLFTFDTNYMSDNVCHFVFTTTI